MQTNTIYPHNFEQKVGFDTIRTLLSELCLSSLGAEQVEKMDFTEVTLPVEINASSRALAWLEGAYVTSASNHGYAKDALKWAAYTYVVAALSSLATLIYYVMIALSRRD